MAVIGIGLLWLAYTAGLYGYILFKGYDIGPRDLFSISQWPPAMT